MAVVEGLSEIRRIPVIPLHRKLRIRQKSVGIHWVILQLLRVDLLGGCRITAREFSRCAEVPAVDPSVIIGGSRKYLAQNQYLAHRRGGIDNSRRTSHIRSRRI